MNKTLTVGLIILCGVLAIISCIFAYFLYERPRFTPAKGDNPYIMFDNKTAQACWSGPEPESAVFEGLKFRPLTESPLPSNNPPHLPFCKDLK